MDPNPEPSLLSCCQTYGTVSTIYLRGGYQVYVIIHRRFRSFSIRRAPVLLVMFTLMAFMSSHDTHGLCITL